MNHYSDQIRAELARYRLFAKRWGVKRVKREVICPCPLWFKDEPWTRRWHKDEPHDWYCKLAATGFFDHASLWGLRRKETPGRGPGPVLFVSQPYHEPSNNGEEGRLWKRCRDMGCTVQFWDPLFSPYYPGRTHLVMVWGPRITPRPMALMGEVRSAEDVWGVDNVLV